MAKSDGDGDCVGNNEDSLHRRLVHIHSDGSSTAIPSSVRTRGGVS
ncbi:hypothetical protein M6B38_208700 [Iris pallida]|uniref:Uncharacterized protein n=1 Tax=Iris pallida TaxID=29817 RepID=A0AAX6E4Q7_IRIPA|nr:hypothetical protein M6B38_208700 [Iris pallida]